MSSRANPTLRGLAPGMAPDVNPPAAVRLPLRCTYRRGVGTVFDATGRIFRAATVCYSHSQLWFTEFSGTDLSVNPSFPG